MKQNIISLSEAQLHKVIKESINHLLYENMEDESRTEIEGGKYVEIDNFDEFKDLLTFNSPDDVYYLMIQQRRKDNPGKKYTNGTCEYLRYYIIKSYQELMSLRSEIRRFCIVNNARAYITANKRSLSTGMDWVKRYKADPRKYRGMRGVETQMAFGRSFENDITRDRILIDIDTDDTSVHDKVHEILKKYGVKIIVEYKSLNNGLHIITDSQEQLLDAFLCKEFLQFDGGKDLGKLATVGMDMDKYTLLYACLEPKGYRAPTSYNPNFQQQCAKDAIEYRKAMGDRYEKITGKKHI